MIVSKRSLALFPLACLLSSSYAAQSAPSMTVSQNANREVVLRVTGLIPSCNLTANSAEPTFNVKGMLVTVNQGVAGYMCTNPPQPDKPYEHAVNLGKLADGTYTINWTFPALTGKIVVSGDAARLSP